jgi:hypothetical protein
MIAKVVSGGQTGVDRAALDVALELEVSNRKAQEQFERTGAEQGEQAGGKKRRRSTTRPSSSTVLPGPSS